MPLLHVQRTACSSTSFPSPGNGATYSREQLGAQTFVGAGREAGQEKCGIVGQQLSCICTETGMQIMGVGTKR